MDGQSAGFHVTLSRAREGDASAAAALFPLVYDQLRRIAGGYFRGQSGSHTLQPTALVHEAFLRLARSAAVSTADRAHFVAVAATAMRQILIDHARRHAADKRGGGLTRVTLTAEQGGAGGDAEAVEVLTLDAALTRLAALNAQQARIIELQYFGGLTVDEVASVLEVSKSTVERDWRRARAWLRAALSEPGVGS